MSEFSDYLSGYLNENGIAINIIAKEMNIDRTVVYRWAKGSRLPANEQSVRKLADALYMTRLQTKKLIETYEKEILGEKILMNYKGFAQMIHDMQERQMADELLSVSLPYRSSPYNSETKTNHQIYSFHGRNEVFYFFKRIFQRLQEGKEYQIYMIFQPDTIQDIFQQMLENTNVRVEQIICLEQDEKVNYKNLKIYSQVLPLCFSNSKYSIRYYYGHLEDHINELSFLPYLFIFKELNMVAQLNYDMESGILVCSEEHTKAMMLQYEKLRENTEVLVRNMSSILDISSVYQEYNTTHSGTLYFQPCIGLGCTKELMHKYLSESPAKEKMIDTFWNMHASFDYEEDMIMTQDDQFLEDPCVNAYFSQKGLDLFIRQGIVGELPRGLLMANAMEDRLTVIRRLLEFSEKGQANFYKVNEEAYPFPENIYILWDDDRHEVRIHKITDLGVYQLITTERGLYRSLQYFLEYISYKNWVSSREEGENCFRQILSEFTDKK